jgi:tRNA(fMet)-specific endonuclease VapC
VTLRYLLDTNVLSEPLRPDPDARVMARLRAHRGEVCTAAPVWNELLYGCYRLPPSRRRRTLEEYLHRTLGQALPVLPYDREAAEEHAAERARLALAGLTPPFVDGQIASIAIARGLTLATHNLDDFANFQGLVCEDWAATARSRRG